MYQAKRLGRNNMQWYQAEMEILQNKRLSLRAMLKRAIENQEFELYYQPQVAAGSRRLVGLEALLRWQHPEQGFIGPDEFIPIAEGVETLAQSTLLQNNVCDELQGYYFSRPLPAEKLEVFLKNYKPS